MSGPDRRFYARPAPGLKTWPALLSRARPAPGLKTWSASAPLLFSRARPAPDQAIALLTEARPTPGIKQEVALYEPVDLPADGSVESLGLPPATVRSDNERYRDHARVAPSVAPGCPGGERVESFTIVLSPDLRRVAYVSISPEQAAMQDGLTTRRLTFREVFSIPSLPLTLIPVTYRFADLTAGRRETASQPALHRQAA